MGATQMEPVLLQRVPTTAAFHQHLTATGRYDLDILKNEIDHPDFLLTSLV